MNVTFGVFKSNHTLFLNLDCGLVVVQDKVPSAQVWQITGGLGIFTGATGYMSSILVYNSDNPNADGYMDVALFVQI